MTIHRKHLAQTLTFNLLINSGGSLQLARESIQEALAHVGFKSDIQCFVLRNNSTPFVIKWEGTDIIEIVMAKTFVSELFQLLEKSTDHTVLSGLVIELLTKWRKLVCGSAQEQERG